MPASIASLTVSRDACDLVTRQVALLATVTPALAEIIVVDNASRDGTAEALARAFPTVTLIRLQEDRGTAGACAAGVEYAVNQRGHDWVWTLDQDSMPASSTLADLVAVAEALAPAVPLGVLAPMPAGPVRSSVYPGLKWRDGTPPLDADGGDLPVDFVDAVASPGSLISAAAIRAAGLPRCDFFAEFVDFELCLRIRRAGFLVGVVPGTAMAPRVRSAQGATGSDPSGAHPPREPWREYYGARNLTFTVWREFPSARAKLRATGEVLRRAAAVVLHDPEKPRRLALMARGLRDGLRGRLGRLVEPEPPAGR